MSTETVEQDFPPTNVPKRVVDEPAPEIIETDFRSVLLTIADARAPDFMKAWEDLNGDLVEENPFYSPWALMPALTAYGDERVKLACVWSGKTLIGLLPVRARRGYTYLPISYWDSWTYKHCFFTAPLVRRGFEDAFFSALYGLLGTGEKQRSFLHLHRLDKDGPLTATALSVAAECQRFAYPLCSSLRAVLTSGASVEATLAVHVRKKKRKELKRLRNRLEEEGVVSIRELTKVSEVDDWVGAFLTLEDKGWKGKKKTSLKATETDALWFRQIVRGAFDAGALNFIRMDVDDRPFAMLVNFVANGAGYSLKICHDPAFSRFSPGVMVEIEAMRSLLARDDFRFIDSCAAPDHSMINGLWRSRRVVTSVNISGAGLGSRVTLGLSRALEKAREKLSIPGAGS